MKISYKWLQDYVKTSLSPEELGERFLLTSSETESLTNWQANFSGLVIGKVLSVKAHPNSDHLHLAKVTLGSKQVDLVCGAPNLAVGQTVIVALPGTIIHPLKGEAFAIKEAVIRGEKSAGMICAADEIGLPLPSEGIMVLPNTLEAGTPVDRALGLDDYVLDLEITPNRPDLLSYTGLAREVATFEKKRLLQPPIHGVIEGEGQQGVNLHINIDNSHHCQRYSAVCLDNIKVEESPLWLQIRLILSGVKPVNNIVDVTNYVMLEIGQPMHAFDLDKLHGPEIKVRSAKTGERLEVLDNSTRELQTGDIVITNNNHPIAIAGIIGSLASSIDSTTKRIVLESATFYGPQIRRTSRRLGLRTEASTRFEKGLDPEMTITALKRAVYLIKELGTGSLCSRLVDNYPTAHQERPRIHLSFAKIQQIAGVHISPLESKSILQKLGFQIPTLNKSSFEAIPPSWRKDVTIPEDLIEELLRIWGYDRIPSSLPLGPIKSPQPNRFFEKKNRTRKALACLGLHEFLNISFTSATNLAKVHWPLDSAVKLKEPLSRETEYLLPTHLIPFLENASGQNQAYTDLQAFEVGHVFASPRTEKETLSLLLRCQSQPENLYRQIKSQLHKLFRELGLEEPQFTPSSNPPAYYQEESCLDIYIQKKIVGQLGLVADSVVNSFKIKSGKNLLYADLDLDLLLSVPEQFYPYIAAPAFPSIERDLTITVDQTTPVQTILDILESHKSPRVNYNWSITSIYTSKPLPEDKKSVTIHFVYNNPERTMEDSEVNQDQTALIETVKSSLNAQISA